MVEQYPEIAAALLAGVIGILSIYLSKWLTAKDAKKEHDKQLKQLESSLSVELIEIYRNLDVTRNISKKIYPSNIRVRFLDSANAFHFYLSTRSMTIKIHDESLSNVAAAYAAYVLLIEHTLPLVGPDDDAVDEVEIKLNNTFIVDYRRIPIFVGALDQCCSKVKVALASLGKYSPERRSFDYYRWRSVVPRRIRHNSTVT